MYSILRPSLPPTNSFSASPSSVLNWVEAMWAGRRQRVSSTPGCHAAMLALLPISHSSDRTPRPASAPLSKPTSERRLVLVLLVHDKVEAVGRLTRRVVHERAGLLGGEGKVADLAEDCREREHASACERAGEGGTGEQQQPAHAAEARRRSLRSRPTHGRQYAQQRQRLRRGRKRGEQRPLCVGDEWG